MSQYHPSQKLFNFTLAFELKRAWDKHICPLFVGCGKSKPKDWVPKIGIGCFLSARLKVE